MSISVVIPCYNQGRFLADAIESLLRQTRPPDEIIVVDDSSTDDTSQVAHRFVSQVRYVHQANSGVSAARNAGAALACGEFLLFLDADDYLELDMLEQMMNSAKASPEAEVLHGSWRTVDLAGQTITCYLTATVTGDVFHAMLYGCFAASHAVIMRRTAFECAGRFDEQLEGAEDWDLWIRLAAVGCVFKAVPQAVSVYRRYPGTKMSDYAGIRATALAMLHKNTARHGSCPACAKAVNSCARILRGGHFLNFMEGVRARSATVGLSAAAGFAAREILRRPIWIPYLGRELLRTIR